MDVGIAGVAEDHAAHLALGQRLSHSLDVIRKLWQRHRAVLDELHRRRVLEPRQYRTRRVTKLPDLALRLRRQGDLDISRPRLAERFCQVRSGRCRRINAVRLDLGEKHRGRAFHLLHESRFRGLTVRCVRQKGLVEKLTRARSRFDRLRRRDGTLGVGRSVMTRLSPSSPRRWPARATRKIRASCSSQPEPAPG